MRLEHTFVIPLDRPAAFTTLCDLGAIAPCMPGAALESIDGEEYRGRIRVKVGPAVVSYRGSARLAEVDSEQYSILIEASGREDRGSGTARATISAHLRDTDAGTRVDVSTELSITGRAAQFGRGIMAVVSEHLLDEFARSLAATLIGSDDGDVLVKAATRPGKRRDSEDIFQRAPSLDAGVDAAEAGGPSGEVVSEHCAAEPGGVR